MKVWINTRKRGYSGGMIIAAANTAEEAHEAFHADERFRYMKYTNIDDEICDFVYKKEDWVELPMLESHVDTPQILAEDGYTE